MRLRLVIIAALLLVAVGAAWYALTTISSDLPELPERSHSRILLIHNPPALSDVGTNFKTRMGELGYAEGSRVTYVEIDVGTDIPATKSRIADAFAGGAFDLVFATGVNAARAAKEYLDGMGLDTPVVFGVVSDPVGGGLVQSLRSSGNNLTGITPASNLTASKRLEFLTEMLPDTERIIIAWNDENTSGIANIRLITASLGLDIVEKKVGSVKEMEAFYRTFDYREGDAILRAADSIAAGAVASLVQIGFEKRVPVVGTNSGDTRRGALMSFGANYGEVGRATARIVDLILKGAHPSDIPVEEASRFEISVNLETARRIGITVPQSFLLKTNIVIPQE